MNLSETEYATKSRDSSETPVHEFKTRLNGRLPSIDGWRAISILFVLIQHSAALPGWPAHFKNLLIDALGGVGVRFFFVISGFLITWLLIKEYQKTKRISLRSFYLRRVFRIFPVLLAYFFVVGLLHVSGIIEVPLINYLIAATFMGDIWNTPHPFGHLWSLGVEEKFYILWPLVFLLLFQKKRSNLVMIIICSLLAAPLLRAMADPLDLQQLAIFNFHSFFIIFDGLAIGCFGALVLSNNESTIRKKMHANKAIIFIASSALVLLPAFFWLIPGLRKFQPLQDTFQCFGFLILLIQSICFPNYLIYKPLNSWIFKHIGTISYSLYVWMGIAELQSVYTSSPFISAHLFPLWLLVVVLFAELSFYFVERPILILRKNKIR